MCRIGAYGCQDLPILRIRFCTDGAATPAKKQSAILPRNHRLDFAGVHRADRPSIYCLTLLPRFTRPKVQRYREFYVSAPRVHAAP